MATFPKLKTGAVLQYPAARGLRFASQVLRFVDGTEQRFRTAAAALRRWEIRLDFLDESEIAEIEQFFLENQGAFGSFSFTDPWDGTEYPNCSLESGELHLLALAEMRGRTALVVRENVN
jgi:phage-related protein